jgi:Protein of unknown function (DUF1566)
MIKQSGLHCFSKCSPQTRWLVVVLPLLVTMHFAAPTATAQIPTVPKLNDTGIDKCYDTGVEVPCAPAASDTGTHPRQDGRYGRDKKPGLTKIGGGTKGFDYTRVCNSGQLAGAGTCPAVPTLGAGSDDWGCTKDNVTNLIWEVKTTAALRDSTHTYTWYSTDTASNGGNGGSVGSDTCSATLPSSLCNTQAFTAAVNAATLCGATDWRLPNRLELAALVDYSKSNVLSPVIDDNYFPNTVASPYFSSSSLAGGSANAWVVNFDVGRGELVAKTSTMNVLLVRGGQ